MGIAALAAHRSFPETGIPDVTIPSTTVEQHVTAPGTAARPLAVDCSR